jgi:hypothetical protein
VNAKGSKNRNHPAVYIEDLSIDEVGCFRAEEHCGSDQFFGSAPSLCRCSAFDPGIKFRIIGQHLSHLGDEISRPDGVDLNIVLRPVRAHGLGQHFQTSFGCGVGTGGGAADFAHQRADIDNLAGTLPDHPFGSFPGDEHGAGEIGQKYLVPCAQVHFFEADPALDAGVVNEHIHAALGVEDFKRLCDFGLLGNVEARFLGA